MSLTVLPFPFFHDWWTTIFSISSFKSGAVSSSMALYFWIKSIQRFASSVSSFVSSSLAEMVLHEQIDYRPKKEHKKPSKLQKQVWRVSVKFFRA
jgi:hypothetical protein